MHVGMYKGIIPCSFVNHSATRKVQWTAWEAFFVMDIVYKYDILKVVTFFLNRSVKEMAWWQIKRIVLVIVPGYSVFFMLEKVGDLSKVYRLKSEECTYILFVYFCTLTTLTLLTFISFDY